MISKHTAFRSVNDSPSFNSISEESEVWMRGPISKLPSLSEPVPSDWEVIEGYTSNHLTSAVDNTFYSITSYICIYLLNTYQYKLNLLKYHMFYCKVMK